MIGRAAELRAVERFADAARTSPAALVVEGEPGIGKTTLWEAGIEAARARGLRVLQARASSAEARLSFAGLTDLLEDVDGPAFAALPAPQRAALEVALLRAEPGESAPEPRAIGVGLLGILRGLAAAGPAVVAVDDLQWQDDASTHALAFAARRLDGEAVSVLLARRPGAPSELERAVERLRPELLPLGPLGLTATGRLLLDRLGLNVRRQLLRRIVETTRGNPLFAIEVGRMLAERGPPATGEDIPVPEVVEDLLGTRITRLPDPVRRLLVAVALSADLAAVQLSSISDRAAVDDAMDAGLLVVDRDHVRASHPLLAAAAMQRSSRSEQRELHAALADLAADGELRAFHLALAAELPDEELAESVAAAAAAAAARGAAEEAVVLAQHALRLTADRARRTDRLLALAGYLNTAGEAVRLTELLAPQLESLPPGEPRVRACLLLSNGAVSGNDAIVGYLERALAESGDDARLRALVLPDIAANQAVARVERIEQAEELAREALAAAPDAGPEAERMAHYALAWGRSLRGLRLDEPAERYWSVADPAANLAFTVDRIVALQLLWRGEVGAARAALGRLLTVADERGEPLAYALQRLHMCELELRAGGWDAATRLLDEWERDGELLVWPCYDRCRALVAAGRGLPDEAEEHAAEALERARRTGPNWDVLEALRARGIAALMTRKLSRAEESLRTVWDHVEREGVGEPGVFPVAPDLVEALADLHKVDDARAVTDRLAELSRAQDHPWGLATANRCRALVDLASDADDPAAAMLEDAAGAYEALGLPFERARTLLSLGRAQRRFKRWGAARGPLEAARDEFDRLGSHGWAELARSELVRLGGRRRAQEPGELTPSERRVVELAADGLSNKEIAQTLVVTVRTVEVHLKHSYAKLGIRSRTQLAGRLSERV